MLARLHDQSLGLVGIHAGHLGEFVDGENIHEIMRIISADSRILCRSRKNHFELYRNR